MKPLKIKKPDWRMKYLYPNANALVGFGKRNIFVRDPAERKEFERWAEAVNKRYGGWFFYRMDRPNRRFRHEFAHIIQRYKYGIWGCIWRNFVEQVWKRLEWEDCPMEQEAVLYEDVLLWKTPAEYWLIIEEIESEKKK
jgi:hypothetical protein